MMDREAALDRATRVFDGGGIECVCVWRQLLARRRDGRPFSDRALSIPVDRLLPPRRGIWRVITK